MMVCIILVVNSVFLWFDLFLPSQSRCSFTFITFYNNTRLDVVCYPLEDPITILIIKIINQDSSF